MLLTIQKSKCSQIYNVACLSAWQLQKWFRNAYPQAANTRLYRSYHISTLQQCGKKNTWYIKYDLYNKIAHIFSPLQGRNQGGATYMPYSLELISSFFQLYAQTQPFCTCACRLGHSWRGKKWRTLPLPRLKEHPTGHQWPSLARHWCHAHTASGYILSPVQTSSIVILHYCSG